MNENDDALISTTQTGNASRKMAMKRYIPVAMGAMVCAFLMLAIGFALLVGNPQGTGLEARAFQSPSDPVAEAGSNRTIVQGANVTLDGSRSTDDGGLANLTFIWSFYNGTGDVNLTGIVVNYTFVVVGNFTVTLNVTDLDGNYSTDTLWVLVRYDNIAPSANAGTPRRLQLGRDATLISLDGSRSTDVGLGIVNYSWNFTYRGQEMRLYGITVAYDFTKAGNYTIWLNVTDANGNYDWDDVNIRIVAKPTFVSQHWMLLFIDIPIIIIAVLFTVSKYRRDRSLFTSTDAEKVKLQWKGFKKNWKIFAANRLGFAGFIVLVIFAIMAVFSPWLSTVADPNKLENQEPTLLPGNPTLKPEHSVTGWVNPLPPSLTPSSYTGIRHLFGTDHKGQDVYSMTIYGSRASLEVGLVATFISVILGASIGLAAGYFGRITDEVLMRVTDFFLVLPWFPLMIVMMAILGQKFLWVVIVIGITSWPSTARIVRSQVLTVKERQFIVRAKCVGASDSHIIKTHIIPNVLPLIFANTVLLIAVAIFSEAFLDFFGLGDTRIISWGAMLESAYEQQAFLLGSWWWIAAPGVAIVMMVLAFSLVGYAVDDVLNPKLRRR